MPNLLKAPKKFALKALKQCISSDWTMCWDNHNIQGSLYTFLFQYKEIQVSFMIQCIGSLPSELDLNITNKFKKEFVFRDDKIYDMFTFTFGSIGTQQKDNDKPTISHIMYEGCADE